MKYLKKFENENTHSLKNYVVWKMKFVLIILEVISQNENNPPAIQFRMKKIVSIFT